MKYLYPTLAVIITACVIAITVKVMVMEPNQVVVRIDGCDNAVVVEE